MSEIQSRRELHKLQAERVDQPRRCVIYQACDETEEEALKRARIKERGIREVVVIRRFSMTLSELQSS